MKLLHANTQCICTLKSRPATDNLVSQT